MLIEISALNLDYKNTHERRRVTNLEEDIAQEGGGKIN
jgi:hypothetical protein